MSSEAPQVKARRERKSLMIASLARAIDVPALWLPKQAKN